MRGPLKKSSSQMADPSASSPQATGVGTPERTIATIIDPDKESPISESVLDLQEKFTQLAIGDLKFGGNLAQFIHF